MSTDEQLAWEERWRLRAALSAALAAVLTLGGGVVSILSSRDIGPDITSQLLYFDANRGERLLAAGLPALGALSLALPLYYLFRAVKFRRKEVPNWAQVMAFLGPVLAAVAAIAAQIILLDKAASFATEGNQTYEEAERVLDSGLVRTVQGFVPAGQLCLGLAFVVISLNAMRVGLLTRFMGVLGIIVGVLFVLPLGTLQIVQPFWLLALAYLISGRWPDGVPPAWETGKAHPWPTQQELRERRERAEAAQPAPEPAAASAPGAQGGGPERAKKRKRKKRR